jgi:uncharacterized radical SAM protein YgiQ
MKPPQFLPTTREEMARQGWDRLDVILISGDAYMDSPFIGVAVIGRFLAAHGFRVGVIAQPDVHSAADITRLDEPRLFWGVSGGSIDSMVANYTASGKRRKSDDYTPGGRNTRRPDRAVIAYANLIRAHFKNTVPIVLGGIEASLRRLAHYDFWQNRIRRSILTDAKADYLLYGMAEYSALALARQLAKGGDPHHLAGLCYLTPQPPESAALLPSFATVRGDRKLFAEMFLAQYENNDPLTASPLAQQQDSRYLVQNPPWPHLSSKELDRIYELDYARRVHPHDEKQGEVRAMQTIRFAITTHRGCYGECNFCAIAVHQGRTVVSRSEQSLLREAGQLVRHPDFKGIISDLGGPTANMYGFECAKKLKKGACNNKRCLYPKICPTMPIDHTAQVRLLAKIRQLPGIRKVVVASGIRYDMVLADKKHGQTYLEAIIRHHVSGQLKIAPEHCVDRVLACMGKPGGRDLLRFRELFFRLTHKAGLKQFLTYYIIAAHPGCTVEDMRSLKTFAQKQLKLIPRQVQIFTPTPATISTLMYWTGKNPLTRTDCFVERDRRGREVQKEILTRAIAGRAKRAGHGRQGISYRSKKTMKKNQQVRKK